MSLLFIGRHMQSILAFDCFVFGASFCYWLVCVCVKVSCVCLVLMFFIFTFASEIACLIDKGFGFLLACLGAEAKPQTGSMVGALHSSCRLLLSTLAPAMRTGEAHAKYMRANPGDVSITACNTVPLHIWSSGAPLRYMIYTYPCSLCL